MKDDRWWDRRDRILDRIEDVLKWRGFSRLPWAVRTWRWRVFGWICLLTLDYGIGRKRGRHAD